MLPAEMVAVPRHLQHVLSVDWWMSPMAKCKVMCSIWIYHSHIQSMVFLYISAWSGSNILQLWCHQHPVRGIQSISSRDCLSPVLILWESLLQQGVQSRLLTHSGLAVWMTPIFVQNSAALEVRSEEHTSELQSPCNLVCRLLLEKKKTKQHSLIVKLQCKW